MNILAIDSSSLPASVCFMRDEKIVSEFFVNNKLTHSQTLAQMTRSVLKNSCIEAKDIDLFAVSTGPGSFTGLRIGISMVKGMALPCGKKCVSVSTLEAMAYNFLWKDCIVCASIDARNNQVYNALFEIKNRRVKRITDDRIIAVDELVAEISRYYKEIFLVGDGSHLCYNNLNKKLNNVTLAPELLLYQRASSIAVVALEKFNKGQITDSLSLAPVYLRPYKAQVTFECRGEK